MPTLRETARYVSKLSQTEYKILVTLEYLSKRFEKISIDILKKYTNLSHSYLLSIIDNLTKHGFIKYFDQPYESISLMSSGLDLLALKKLTDKNIISGVGRQIGIGKEADVYEAIDLYGNLISIKIYRLGRVSFRNILKHRKYVNIKSSYRWIKRNYISAKREYNNLLVLYQRGVSVPRPIYRLMHILVMESLNGWLLHDLSIIDNPYDLFTRIIYEIKKTWDIGFVNGDLSEYNIIILKDVLQPVLIDWPQAYTREEENSRYYLKKDISNIIYFFKKRYECDERKLSKIVLDISLKTILK